MSALKNQILNEISALENKKALRKIADYINILKENEEWEATLEIIHDKKYMSNLLKGIRSAKKGDLRDIEEVRKEREKNK